MRRSSKDLAKRLRFDAVPRRDVYRRWLWVGGLLAVVAGAAVWLSLDRLLGARQYLPGPVAQSHATFGERCDACHSSFQAVRDEACLACHAPRIHSVYEVETPACRDCHVEHRGREALLAVSNQSCVACHADLPTTRPALLVHPTLASFADHPRFRALRAGRRDVAAVRFNHRIHLTSESIPARDRLACVTCHRSALDGRGMRPIVFERDCQRCHRQDVRGPLGALEVLHEDPARVRQDLKGRLLIVAVEEEAAVFGARRSSLPGIRPRPPVDRSASLGEYQATRVAALERQLYAPFREAGSGASRLEENPACFLCHFEGEGAPDSDAPAVIAATAIPDRWLTRGEFAHRRHDMLDCQVCHAEVAASTATADVNLPDVALCQRCHVDGRGDSAGTRCPLCHLYHDTSRDPAMRSQKRPHLSIDRLHAAGARG